MDKRKFIKPEDDRYSTRFSYSILALVVVAIWSLISYLIFG